MTHRLCCALSLAVVLSCAVSSKDSGQSVDSTADLTQVESTETLATTQQESASSSSEEITPEDSSSACTQCDESLAKFDLDIPTAEEDTMTGGMLECTKIDLLFAIDTSGSMGDEQERLISTFPEFAKAMADQLQNVESLHIGVVSSDENTPNEPANCQQTGGLIVQSGCGEALHGKRYIDESDDIVDAFACNAALGLGGQADNRTMANLTAALQLQEPCNEGFLRDDALLVLVIITDEEDDHFVPAGSYPGSPGDPPDWFDAVAQAKGGQANRAVVMAIVQPPEPNACSAEQNADNIKVWAQADRIIDFAQRFDHHVVADICQDSYTESFQSFLDSISKGCDDFLPPK